MPSLILDPKKTAGHPENVKAVKAPSKNGWTKAVVWSLIIFGFINLVLWRLEEKAPDATSKDLFHGSGSVGVSIDAFKAAPKKPNVVLLGSSLVMFPFWSMDMSMDKKNMVDIFHHQRSIALEQELIRDGFKDPKVFSFAIFGQMVSDAYLFTNEFLTGKDKPEYIVYGIAPRDFNDADLSSPMTTNSFKRLVNLGNFAKYADLYLPSMQEKLDFVLGRLCYFYGHRWRLQQDVNKAVERVYIFAGIHQEKKKVDFKNAGFMMFGGERERWQSSEDEYQRRYKNMSAEQISLQMSFLKKLLAETEKEKIKVVVVNMPLSQRNRKHLPKGFYSYYQQALAQECSHKGVRLVDLGANPEFVDQDYWDTAHLGPTGGFKLLHPIAQAMMELKSEERAK